MNRRTKWFDQFVLVLLVVSILGVTAYLSPAQVVAPGESVDFTFGEGEPWRAPKVDEFLEQGDTPSDVLVGKYVEFDAVRDLSPQVWQGTWEGWRVSVEGGHKPLEPYMDYSRYGVGNFEGKVKSIDIKNKTIVLEEGYISRAGGGRQTMASITTDVTYSGSIGDALEIEEEEEEEEEEEVELPKTDIAKGFDEARATSIVVGEAAQAPAGDTTPSRLVLKGKRCNIILDADAGGIWVASKKNDGLICVFSGYDQGAPYVGIYKDLKGGACHAALGVDNEGHAMLQTRDGHDVDSIDVTKIITEATLFDAVIPSEPMGTIQTAPITPEKK